MPASKKLVLLAMCDWANDMGLCFPSMSTVARKTCISKRQCQRIISELVAESLITVVANQLGGARPRRYQIHFRELCTSGSIDTGDKLSPAPITSCLPMTPASDTDDAHVTRTTTNHQVEPSLLHEQFEALDWTYLSALQNADRVVVVNLLKGLEQSMRQELLDELAGAKRANAIKGQWPAWLRGVVRHAHSGAFVPNHALHIRRDRQHRLALAEDEALRLDRQMLEAARRKDPAAHARNKDALATAIAELALFKG